MDIEHLLFKEGIKENYNFYQNDENIYFEIIKKNINFEFLKETNEVIVTDDNDNDILVGELYKKCEFIDKYINKNDLIEIKFKKEEPYNWPYPIVIGKNSGIDGKSAFLLVLYCDSMKLYDEALQYIQISYSKGFFLGSLLYADILCDSKNIYTSIDLNKSIEIYEYLLNENESEKIALKLFNVLINIKNYEKASKILQRFPDNIEFQFKLINLYLSEEFYNPNEAIFVLKLLGDENNVEANLLLSKIYEEGKIVEKNLYLSREYRRLANFEQPLIDCEIQNDEENSLEEIEIQSVPFTDEIGIQNENLDYYDEEMTDCEIKPIKSSNKKLIIYGSIIGVTLSIFTYYLIKKKK